jgi:hypothetical protein
MAEPPIMSGAHGARRATSDRQKGVVDVDISLDYGLTLLAALLIGTGFVLQQQSAQREPTSSFLSLRLISTNLVFALLLSVPIAKASLRFSEIFGSVVLCTGVALLSASRSAKPIGLSFGSVSHWPAAAVIAGIAAIAVHQGRLHPGRLRAMLTGTGAGLVFGIQDALTRQTLEILESNGVSAVFTTWAPYALVGAGATGIWLMQSAFNSGPLPLSLPAISAGEPLVGILLGVLVFGDRIQISPGELALQAGGIVALVVGVIMVGRAPALSQLRTWPPPGLPHIPGGLPHIPGGLPALPGRPGRAGRSSAEARDPETGAHEYGLGEHRLGEQGYYGNGADAGHPNGRTPTGNRPTGSRAGDAVQADTVSADTVSADTVSADTVQADARSADQPADRPNPLTQHPVAQAPARRH